MAFRGNGSLELAMIHLENHILNVLNKQRMFEGNVLYRTAAARGFIFTSVVLAGNQE